VPSEAGLRLRGDVRHIDGDLEASGRQTEGRRSEGENSFIRHCSLDPMVGID
jgi:hypothetical protein